MSTPFLKNGAIFLRFCFICLRYCFICVECEEHMICIVDIHSHFGYSIMQMLQLCEQYECLNRENASVIWKINEMQEPGMDGFPEV